MVSYQLLLLIAKKSAPHTTDEKNILPAIKLMSALLLVERATKTIRERVISILKVTFTPYKLNEKLTKLVNNR